ncbi:hypothetical protein VBD025_09445 [Virgibacillus flavescens]|uniref:hypothetical protein n=1 Tax=Virgibacillus flavescens TaxID=1611422 RepID=UPI003D3566C9
MNTEINFLEKKTNRSASFIKFSILFFFLLICASALVVFQHNNIQGEIENKAVKLSGLEKTLSEQQKENKDLRTIESVTSAIESIKSSSNPTVKTYNNILALLPEYANFNGYEVHDAEQILVNVQYKTLSEIASLVSKLQEQSYVREVEVTTISLNEDAYQTTLAVSTDPEALLKEFKQDE